VPANVQVVTEVLRQPGALAAVDVPGRAGGPAVMTMDLTTDRTAQWLRKKSVVSADCGNCCCVRG
jgi:hypothetical protein